jgi:hypothetical protein
MISKRNAIAASATATPKLHRRTRDRGPVPNEFSMYLERKTAPVPLMTLAQLGGPLSAAINLLNKTLA